MSFYDAVSPAKTIYCRLNLDDGQRPGKELPWPVERQFTGNLQAIEHGTSGTNKLVVLPAACTLTDDSPQMMCDTLLCNFHMRSATASMLEEIFTVT
jgi:hypothetical protein